jgi:hypothetical protein
MNNTPDTNNIKPNRLRWGPITGLVLPDQAAVKWSTEAPCICSVFFAENVSMRVESNGIFHSLCVKNLRPDTIYQYSIGITGSDETAGPFILHTPAENPSEWGFTVYGDTRGNDQEPHLCTNTEAHQQTIAAMLASMQANEFYISTGDLVDRGERMDNWDRFFSIEKSLQARHPFLPIRGNHDVSPEIFSGIFYNSDLSHDNGKNWYGFRYANAIFLLLNSGWDGCNNVNVCEEQLEQQIPFIRKMLSEGDEKILYKLVFIHIPPFASGNYGCNDYLTRVLVPIFEQYGVSCVFSAHNHLYERSCKNQTTYIVTGGGGAPFQQPPGTNPNPYSVTASVDHHFIKVRANAERMELKVIATSGTIIDEFVIYPQS